MMKFMHPKINPLIIIIVMLFYYRINAQDYSNSKLYGDIADGLPDYDTIVELKKDELLLGEGAFAVSNYGLSNLRVGYWREYSENGILKMEGSYKLGSFINCCLDGYCHHYYYYRSGLWKIYDENGDLKYEFTYEPTELHIETSCEGGDNLLFGIIKEIPIKYWLDNLTSEKIFELQKVYTEDEIWTPLNSKIFIEAK